MKNRITIGLSSIVLILLILCLSVFGLLSLSDAKNALSFAERHGASVKAYYAADAHAQKALAALPADADGIQIIEIPMAAGQSLHVEVDGQSREILKYYVYNSEDYEIDNRLPVWDGVTD